MSGNRNRTLDDFQEAAVNLRPIGIESAVADDVGMPLADRPQTGTGANRHRICRRHHRLETAKKFAGGRLLFAPPFKLPVMRAAARLPPKPEFLRERAPRLVYPARNVRSECRGL